MHGALASLHAIVRATIKGVEPTDIVRRALQNAVDDGAKIRLVSVGKAAGPMAAAAIAHFGPRIVRGLVIAPQIVTVPPHIISIVGGHPVPTDGSVRAGRSALVLAEGVQPGERLLCLLSGGASALMAAPTEGVSIQDKQATTRELLRRGADITALNAVRKHLSDIKGGGLAERSCAGCWTLAISDVVGDDLAVIGSGPGVPDPTTYADALAVLDSFGGLENYSPAVVGVLKIGVQGERPETLKPEDEAAELAIATVIGGRRDAMNAARDAARELGYRTITIEEAVVGDAREAAHALVQRVLALPRDHGPVCLISSGETTVHVTGTGIGGRNQELALAVAIELKQIGLAAYLASVGTDGVDGPTDAAGAIIDHTTVDRARAAGLDADLALRNNDSYTFFSQLGDAIKIGPTHTNVGDVQVVLVD